MFNLILAAAVGYSFFLGYSISLWMCRHPQKETGLVWDHSQILLLMEENQQ